MWALLLGWGGWAWGGEAVPLTLAQAHAALDDANPTLARADAAVAAAEAARVSAWAPALPSVAVNAGYVRNNLGVSLDFAELFAGLGTLATTLGLELPTRDPVVLQPLDAVSGNVQVRVPIVAASTWVQGSVARLQVDAAEAAAEVGRRAAHAQLDAVVWAAEGVKAQIAVLEGSQARLAALVAVAERTAAAGLGTPLDRLTVQTDLVKREAEVVAARAALARAEVALGAVLGRAEAASVAPEDGQELGFSSLVDAQTAALAARPEVRAADLGVDAANRARLAAKLGAVPSLAAGFQASASSAPYVTGKDYAWRASVDLTWALAQGGARSAGVARAVAGVDDAEAARRAAAVAVAQQVGTAWADLDAARARDALLLAQRNLAFEAHAASRRAYEGGLLDVDALLRAEERLAAADLALADAHARVGATRAALRAAVGSD